ncbi:hypothetical protein Ancab_034085 [Ancistrocladus abbreviatus]
MAEIEGRQAEVQGIKLFGTTIVLTSAKEEDPNCNKINNDQTAEKRPDKIIPCPRCKSMETKFCYFNNYNVNQPRHFCKGCQRYWTAGGALRNVPVGAGRRKNKPPGRGLAAFPENCVFDASGELHQFDLDGMVVQQWHLAAAAGGFQHDFPAKRRRISNGSSGQTC